jgi:uncharacterized membrane protein YozB (DUF420 family)
MTTTVTSRRSRRGWLAPAGLLVLSFIPVLAGALRVTELAGGPAVMPDNERFAGLLLPLLVHIIGATVYCVLGAFQFPARFRGRHRGWHRVAGRLLVGFGLFAALSGLWLTFTVQPLPGDGALLKAIRLVVGSLMAFSIVAGFTAALRRDFVKHRAWMIRGYAIGQGAGTQAVTQVPWVVLTGIAPHGLSRTLLLGAGWVINLVIAELIIRRVFR